MKLEIKHIVPYLAHGILAYDEEQESKTDKIVGLFHDTIDFENWSPLNSKIDHYKLILRPLSDLSKPCLEGGLIPIVELAKISHGLPIKDWRLEGDCATYDENYGKIRFDLNILPRTKQIISINKTLNGSFIQMNNPLELFEKLFEWHFDVYGLIENGLAIDLNTI